MHKKFLGVAIVVLIVVGALTYRTPSSVSPTVGETPEGVDHWRTYSNSDLGVSFQYPPEWGEVSYRDAVLWFSKNDNVHVYPFTGTEAVVCPEPKTIMPYHEYYADGIGYCRLFKNDQDEQMIEAVRIGSLPQIGGPYLTQEAFVGKFDITQSFSDVDATHIDARSYLQSILDRSAPADVLQKIDTFEQVMLTLEVK